MLEGSSPFYAGGLSVSELILAQGWHCFQLSTVKSR